MRTGKTSNHRINLSEADKQEAIRCLHSGLPLPPRYRFLLFGDNREVELLWQGKSSEVTSAVLPFHTIERVDEPRASTQRGGWTNKLIYGDNKLVLSSLIGGALRQAIDEHGGIKLIYIDPPFAVGADFPMSIEVGERGGRLAKPPSAIEEIAYRDTWGSGADSFLAMIYERIRLMRDLLADDGTILVHCDYRLTGELRLVLNEVFGAEAMVNELIWSYRSGGGSKHHFGRKHDTIFLFRKGSKYHFDADSPYARVPHHAVIAPQREHLFDARGKVRPDVLEISRPPNHASEWLGYPTQKPEALLKTLIDVLCPKGGIVADFFCGSGTTAAVAEKLGRKWIASDLGKFAIHTTHKRMITVQRELKEAGGDFRAFELLHLGKYESSHHTSINAELPARQRAQPSSATDKAFVDLIIRAYRGEPVKGFTNVHGKKNGRMIAVAAANLPVTGALAGEIIRECRAHNLTQVDVLGFEFAMGMFPKVIEEARAAGIDLAPKYIPREVFDKRAIARHQLAFHDVAHIHVRAHIHGGAVSVELTGFELFYSQDSAAIGERELASSKIAVQQGQVVKVSKSADGTVRREVLTKMWSDWIDYWSVDFDFESRKDTIAIWQPEMEKYTEHWSGNYVFENRWQSFRTRKNRSLALRSAAHHYRDNQRGCRKIAVKVVDIFGNDTMTLIEVIL